MIKAGEKVQVKITSIAAFGAFCEVENEEIKGLIHISEISDFFVNDINEFFQIGEEYEVEVLSVDEGKKQAKLSYKRNRPELLKSGDKPKLNENGSGFKGLKSSIEKHISNKSK